MLLRAKDRMIASTIELIATNGVAGTGISELIEHSDVSRRTMYVNFPGGKSELVADATRQAGRSMTETLRGFLADTPVELALPAFGAWWAETLEVSAFTRGCPMMAAVLGRAEVPAAADYAEETFGRWTELLRARLESDGIDSSESRSLAVTIIAAIEGAVLASLAAHSTAPLYQATRQMARLVAVSVAQPARIT